jgi:predicted acetyltransferase
MAVEPTPGVEIVHPVPVDEIEQWAATMATAFLDDPSDEGHRRGVERMRLMWDAERRWGARADGQWVGTLGTWERTLTVPTFEGKAAEVPADALTMVTVAATHRRRGLLTAMLTESLRAARDRGDAVSVLWAAEWPIYWRFGYAPASTTASYVLSPRSPGGSLVPSGTGTVRQVDVEETAIRVPAVFDVARHLRAGNIDRPRSWWDATLGLAGNPPPGPGLVPTTVVREGPDGPDGFVSWLPSRGFDIDGTAGAIKVTDLCAGSDAAYRDLWAYLTGIDLVGEITIRRRPPDEPLRWLLHDGRALRQTYAGDGLWLRVLDVPAALSARRYAVADRLVLDVVDDDIDGFASGRFVLDGGPDGAQCSASTVDSADLRVHQRALAAAYLGGFSLHGQQIAGRVDELTPGALRRADAMFATPLAPWCATGF